MAESAPPSPVPSAPRRPRRWVFWTLLVLGGLLLAALLAVYSAGQWALTTEAGARAVIERIPGGVQVVEPHGPLMGGPDDVFTAQRIEIPLPDGRRLVIEQPSWRDLTVRWQPDAPWRIRVGAAQLHARRVSVEGARTQPPSPTPPQPPASLAAPLSLDIAQLVIDEVNAPELGENVVRDLRFGLRLGTGPLGVHQLSGLSVQWNGLQATGEARIEAQAPMPLSARVQLAPRPGAGESPAAGDGALRLPEQWNASIGGEGTLEHIAVTVTLRARQQSLDAAAQVSPFDPQPVPELRVQARGFDIAPFVRGAPTTALTGRVDVQLGPGGTGTRPIDVAAMLRNERPTAWGQGGVPVRELELAAATDVAVPARGTVRTLRLQLGTGAQMAGQVVASGRWDRSAGALQLQGQADLSDVFPARLDPRAPALQASGPVRWQLVWPEAGGSGEPRGPALRQLELELSGRALALPRSPPLQLRLQGSGDARAFTIAQLDARAGGSRAVLSGRGERLRGDRWHLAGQLALTAFDPSLWWPAGAEEPWRRGPHRLDGELRFDVDASPLQRTRGTSPLVTALAAVRGDADLSLRDSRIAGVPLSGRVNLRAPRAARDEPPLRATLELRSGASELKLDAQLDPAEAGRNDRWQAQWRTPAVQAFAPLVRLARGTAEDLPLQGDTAGTLDVSGRWPQARIQGQLRSTLLRAGAAEFHEARITATLEGGADGTVDLRAELQRLLLQGRAPTAQDATLRVQGSAASHRIQASAELAAVAPAGATAAASPWAPRVPRRLRATLDAQGRWTQGGTGASQDWSGELQRVELRDPDEPDSAPPWLRLAIAAPLELSFGAAARKVQLGEARVVVAGAALRVERALWQQPLADNAAGNALTDLRILLEPLPVATLLARLQPDFGWSGDLRMAGRVELRRGADGRVQADIEVARADGDLQILEPGSPDGPQRLGLSDLRIGLQARDGQWVMQQRVRGGNLGSLEGSQKVRAAATAWWPAPESPLEGQLDLRVENLGAWSLWLPAGWRLTGELNTQARVGGRFGAPQFTGELNARNMGVHNLLQGVDWRDAALHVVLQGAGARVQSFSARAGNGTLTGTGELRLGEEPRVVLRLAADRFAALQRVDRRIVLSGHAELSADRRGVGASGKVHVDEGRIDISQGDAPSLDDDVAVRRGPQDDEAAQAVRQRGEDERRIALDLLVDLGDALHLRGRGVDTRLTGELRLTSPANRLAVNGTVRAADGTYAAYAQKLTIDRGIVTFTGTPNNPRLDIEATRPNMEEVRVGVAITGTAQNPRVRLFSEPEMSDTDKLSWLVLGRPSDGLGRTDLALLQRAAYALLAGENSGPSIVERVGLDELSVRQNDATGTGGANVRETVVSLGKQLSRRWYVGYERSLNAVAGTWQLVYRAAQRFTLRAQSGVQNSLDLIWTWQWN